MACFFLDCLLHNSSASGPFFNSGEQPRGCSGFHRTKYTHGSSNILCYGIKKLVFPSIRLNCCATMRFRRLSSLEKARYTTFNNGAGTKSHSKRKRIAIFLSGGGSNFKSIHQACLQGLINGDISVVVTSNLACGGATYAESKGIPLLLFPKKETKLDGLSQADLLIALRRLEVDLVILAGYLKRIPVDVIRAYPKSILNIHPSLLPSFGGKGYYGMKVHRAVIASGARYTGATVHFVDEHYDTGRILAQRVVPVHAYDTVEELAARVLMEEHKLYVEAIAAFCEGRVMWREDEVPLLRSRDNPNDYC